METEFDLPAGETVFRQGDTGHGFYILRSGTLEVYKNDLLLNVLTFPGTIFGEMSDILHQPRSCTIRTRTRCRLYYCDETDIKVLMQHQPDTVAKIIRTLASRLDRTTVKLAEQFTTAPVPIEPESKVPEEE